MSKITVHGAMIIHEYGVVGFVAPTEEALKAKIADWCREYWDDYVEADFGLETDPPEKDSDVVQQYFEAASNHVTGESCDIWEAKISIEEARDMFLGGIREGSSIFLPGSDVFNARTITKAAFSQGEKQEDQSHEIEALQSAVHHMWDLMTEDQKKAFLSSPEIADHLVRGGVDMGSLFAGPADSPPSP